ncbi:MAG: hypothetical protein HUU55_09430 [Myxococcales bacterium]|nr:hypothetical protein [Myxococcales bacterium]
MEQTQITFDVLQDIEETRAEFTKLANISPYPFDVLVGPDGKVIYIATEFNLLQLQSKIVDALKQHNLVENNFTCE